MLIKTAISDKTKERLKGGGELAAGLGAGYLGSGIIGNTVMDPKFRENMTGRRRLLHGTSPEAAESIKRTGLMRTTRKNAINTNIIEKALGPEEYEKALNKVYMTGNLETAQNYAAQGMLGGVENTRRVAYSNPQKILDAFKRAENGEGIVHIDLPTYKFKSIPNPEAEGHIARMRELVRQGKATPKQLSNLINNPSIKGLQEAYVTPHDIPTKYIRGSKDFRGVGLRDMLEYAKADPKTLGKTVGKLGLGAAGLIGAGYLGYKGIQHLRARNAAKRLAAQAQQQQQPTMQASRVV